MHVRKPGLRALKGHVWFRLLALGGCVAAVLAACGQPAPSAPAPRAAPAAASAPAQTTSEWEQVLEAARREGEIGLYGGSGQDNRLALVEPFQRAYPGIKVTGTFAPGRDLVTRIAAERQAEKYLADVLIGPGASGLIPLKPIGALAPLEPALLLPEVTDLSAWLQNKLWFLDETPPLTTLGYEASVQMAMVFNTQQLDPQQIRSYWDLVDPKWKSKIVATDVRRPGPGAVPTRYMYKHPDLGPRFLERLFAEMDMTLGSDQRQMVDWVAQGRFPIGLFLNPPDVLDAIHQGLPVGVVPGDQFKEGTPIGPSGGTVNLLDRAPHPNAARVYVNWLLSRDGQIAWQRFVRGNSARIDIPKDGIPSYYLPNPGVRYVNAATEEYAHLSGTVITDLITNALEKSR
jgi:iron(III) transport system substrate-binding protein